MADGVEGVNRNSKVIRLLNVIMDLAQRRGASLEELAEEYGVDARTIRRDLDAIRAAGIEVEQRSGRYRIPAGAPLLPMLQMTQDEAFLFAFCMSMVRRETLPRDRRDLEKLRKKVEVLLPKSVSEVADRLANLYYPMNRPVTAVTCDAGTLRDLEDAVTSRSWVRFWYTKREEESPGEYIVFPHAPLTCYGRIYLLAHERERLGEAPRLFAAARIEDGEIMAGEEAARLGLERPEPVDVEEVAQGSFGLWQDEAVEVEIVFRGDAVESIQNTVFHPSQKVAVQPDGTARAVLTCGGHQEITWWVLGFGDKAEVVRPEAMREEIVRTLRRSIQQYKE